MKCVCLHSTCLLDYLESNNCLPVRRMHKNVESQINISFFQMLKLCLSLVVLLVAQVSSAPFDGWRRNPSALTPQTKRIEPPRLGAPAVFDLFHPELPAPATPLMYSLNEGVVRGDTAPALGRADWVGGRTESAETDNTVPVIHLPEHNEKVEK